MLAHGYFEQVPYRPINLSELIFRNDFTLDPPTLRVCLQNHKCFALLFHRSPLRTTKQQPGDQEVMKDTAIATPLLLHVIFACTLLSDTHSVGPCRNRTRRYMSRWTWDTSIQGTIRFVILISSSVFDLAQKTRIMILMSDPVYKSFYTRNLISRGRSVPDQMPCSRSSVTALWPGVYYLPYVIFCRLLIHFKDQFLSVYEGTRKKNKSDFRWKALINLRDILTTPTTPPLSIGRSPPFSLFSSSLLQSLKYRMKCTLIGHQKNIQI